MFKTRKVIAEIFSIVGAIRQQCNVEFTFPRHTVKETEVAAHGIRHRRTLRRNKRHNLRRCLPRRLHPPQENATHGDGRPSFDEVSQLYIDISRWMICQRSGVLRRKSTTQDRRIRDRSMLTRSSRGSRIQL
jgi:hypothetical protein